ncbi:MAG: hypothetical protein VR67_17970 [Peptococcaceae bacterium BRH_c8a]|nr:MAG: hypothetical protein VR67_17970 [Peptococcaceae bacterium BRH_c8a]
MDKNTEIYQKKTVDAALSTISTKMEELTVDIEIKRRRWIWELIQNANDCATEAGVTIWIETNNDELIFSHDGYIFTYNNLVDLITQISSKRTDDGDNVGKFGTGFISTHLISEIVTIKGVYCNRKNSTDYKNLELVIDRSGRTDTEIQESIVKSFNDLEIIDSSQNIEWCYEKGAPATSFVYDLTNNRSKDITDAIKSGKSDLDKSIAFVLAFSNKINRVNFNKTSYFRNSNKVTINENMRIIDVENRYEDPLKSPDCRKILVCSDQAKDVSIATLIEPCGDNNVFRCLPMKDMTKLYCTFPLIGTENFYFPIALHSPRFRVLQERNDINEGNSTNKDIVETAVRLYEEVINFAYKNNWSNLYNLCYMSKSKDTPFQKEVFNSIEAIYNVLPIVDVQEKMEVGRKESLFSNIDGKLIPNIIVPFMDKVEHSDELWELISLIKTKPIPTKESSKYWATISPYNKVTLQNLYDNLLKDKMMSDFLKRFDSVDYVIPWLNKFYSLWIESSNNQEFLSKGIVPNQNEQFVGVSKLNFDDNIDEELKEILTFFEPNFKAKLLYKGITALTDIRINSLDNEDVSSKINDHVRKQFSDESNNTVKRTNDIQDIFNRLSDWFLKNPDRAKPLFKDIFDKKYQLSTQEETIRRLELAANVESTMNKNNLELAQLDIVIKESARLLQMFEDGEIMLSEEAKKLFQHISLKSIYSKERLDYLIKRSIENIYSALSKNPLYTISASLDEWQQSKHSTTVFPAVKDHKMINIVIRPSDDDKIIFYEDAELEALDDTACELWTDDGTGTVRMITLGDLIKTTGMTSIPLKKVF